MDEQFIKNNWNQEVNEVSQEQIESSLNKILNRIFLFELAEIKLKNRQKIRSFCRVAALCLLFVTISGISNYRKNSEGYLKYTTQAKEVKKIILSDNTIVFLNSSSSLLVPKRFTTETRTVYLSGEAYFHVHKNENQPFWVKTHLLDVQVVGTEFCTKAYPKDNYIETTLINGVVQLLPHSLQYEQEDIVCLKPGQHSLYASSARDVLVKQVNPVSYVSWIDGNIIFENTPFSEVVERLKIQFDTSVFYSEELEESSITAKFIRKESLTDILQILSDVAHFEWSVVNNQTYIFMKSNN